MKILIIILTLILAVMATVSGVALIITLITPTTPGWYAFSVQLFLMTVCGSTSMAVYALIERLARD